MVAGNRIATIGIVAVVLATLFQFALAETPSRAANTTDPAKEKLKERLAVLSEIVGLRQASYQLGESSLDDVLQAQTNLSESELELAATAAQRITILEHLVSVTKQREEYATRLAQEQAVSKVDLLTVKAALLRAEADLLRARGGQ
jgi:outer membrane protein TolC